MARKQRVLSFMDIAKQILANHNHRASFSYGGSVDLSKADNMPNKQRKNYMELINEYHKRQEPKYKYYGPTAPINKNFEQKLVGRVQNKQNAQIGAVQNKYETELSKYKTDLNDMLNKYNIVSA